MSDHKELIAEGHRLGLFDDEATDYGDQYRRLIHRLTVALTDALAAAQPRQIDRDEVAKAIAEATIDWDVWEKTPGALAFKAADAIIANLASSLVEGEVEWGTITVDNPTGVNVTTRERAFEDVAAWNSTRRVRHEGGIRGAVVTRTVGPWVEVQS